MRVYEVMSSNLIARKPEHVSNRALRKAREEQGWEQD